MGVSIRKPPPLYVQTVEATKINPADFVLPSPVVGCTNVKYRTITRKVWDSLAT